VPGLALQVPAAQHHQAGLRHRPRPLDAPGQGRLVLRGVDGVREVCHPGARERGVDRPAVVARGEPHEGGVEAVPRPLQHCPLEGRLEVPGVLLELPEVELVQCVPPGHAGPAPSTEREHGDRVRLRHADAVAGDAEPEQRAFVRGHVQPAVHGEPQRLRGKRIGRQHCQAPPEVEHHQRELAVQDAWKHGSIFPVHREEDVAVAARWVRGSSQCLEVVDLPIVESSQGMLRIDEGL